MKKEANLPLVSVVIPVFNSAGYLHQCLDSVVAQNYPSLEIILIDDGSTDGSAEICDLWAQKFPRVIRVEHLENKGPGAARNKGAELAKGDYIQFIDSDDLVSPLCISSLVDVLIKSGADIVRFPRPTFFEATSCPLLASSEDELGELRIFSAHDSIKNILYQTWEAAPYLSLQKRELVMNNPFPDYVIAEDLLQAICMLSHCRSVAYISSTSLYGYRQVSDGLMRSAVSQRKVESTLCASAALYNLIESWDESLCAAASSRAASLIRSTLAQCASKSPESHLLFEELKKYRRVVLHDGCARRRERFAIFLSFFGERFFLIFCKACRIVGLMR